MTRRTRTLQAMTKGIGLEFEEAHQRRLLRKIVSLCVLVRNRIAVDLSSCLCELSSDGRRMIAYLSQNSAWGVGISVLRASRFPRFPAPREWPPPTQPPWARGQYSGSVEIWSSDWSFLITVSPDPVGIA